jgi:hypothetical protein
MQNIGFFLLQAAHKYCQAKTGRCFGFYDF